jgi:cytidylate kinase
MYRALAWKALQQQVPLDDAAALRHLAERTDIRLVPRGEGNQVLLDGCDVSQRIRQSDVTAAASRVSVHPAVRQLMVARQRALGEQGGVVMEGRDIGTAVFPDAEVKIFLDADAGIRASRRVLQNGSQSPEEAERVRADIIARDERDRTRAVSPLTAAPDAVIVDTTEKSIDQVVSEIEAIVGRAGAKSQLP